MKTALTLLTLILTFPLTMPLTAQNAPVIDHLIVGINDLERGIRDFEDMTGVRPVFGGVHPGRGTQNALVSLGDGVYLEIIAPDPKQSVASDMVKELKRVMVLTPVAWAVGTGDMFSLQAKLQAREIRHGAMTPGSRALPDGSLLRWSTTEITLPQHNWLPFFIKWSDPAKHPSRTTPTGCSLTSMQIEDPNPDPLTHVFSAIGLKLPAKKSAQSRMTIWMKCPKGPVTFQGSAR